MKPTAISISLLYAIGTGQSFSHGFFRFAVVARDSRPSRTVSGTSFMFGMGWPVVISSTIWLNVGGYGAVGGAGAEAVEDVAPPGRGGEWFERSGVVLELDSAGGSSGRVESMEGPVAVKEVGLVAPLARDWDECWVCQVL